MIERQIESPMPIPLDLVVKKALNNRSTFSAEILTPQSVTLTRVHERPGRTVSAAGTGMTVNAVLPRPIRSDGAVALHAKLAAERGVSVDQIERQFIATRRPTSLIRRLITVEEVANIVVYGCSEQASATTAAALRVDGGMLRSIA
jgi:enoyl-[acyl-carrier-protein] reductase (NADH)